MTTTRGSTGTASLLLAVIAPMVLVIVILTADLWEGPKTAYVGVLSVVPMLAAVFGTPLQTAMVGVLTWLSALGFGLIASDGNAPAQTVRLVIIAIISLLAVIASRLRLRRDDAYFAALQDAALAAELKQLALTDELTSLLNRRGALQRIESGPPSSPCTIAIVDSDNLKQVNDEYGHNTGDEYLRAVAGRFARAVSGGDIIARWGGDEFLFVVNQPMSQAVQILERARGAIVEHVIQTERASIPASVSIGAAEWREGQPLDEVLHQADAALYRAKSEGRNQLVLHS